MPGERQKAESGLTETRDTRSVRKFFPACARLGTNRDRKVDRREFVNLESPNSTLVQPDFAPFVASQEPDAAPGLAAAFSLVFLSVVTELTATLLLIPTGVQTLSTQFWVYQQNLSYSQAAPFALLMMGIAAVPSIVLGRWFDRDFS